MSKKTIFCTREFCTIASKHLVSDHTHVVKMEPNCECEINTSTCPIHSQEPKQKTCKCRCHWRYEDHPEKLNESTGSCEHCATAPSLNNWEHCGCQFKTLDGNVTEVMMECGYHQQQISLAIQKERERAIQKIKGYIPTETPSLSTTWFKEGLEIGIKIISNKGVEE